MRLANLHPLHIRQEVRQPLAQPGVTTFKATDMQAPGRVEFTGQVQAPESQLRQLWCTGKQAGCHIQGNSALGQLDRILRLPRQGQLQAFEHQYRGKRMPLGADLVRVDVEWNAVVQLPQDFLLVGACQRAEHAPHAYIDGQQHYGDNDGTPKYAAEPVKDRLFQWVWLFIPAACQGSHYEI